MHIARKIEAVIGSFFGWLIFVPLSIAIAAIPCVEAILESEFGMG